MNRESTDAICITVCIVAFFILVGLWLYWILVVQRQMDVEIIRAMGSEAYIEMRKCLTIPSLCDR